ncbi:MAG: hypothetical protein H0U63_04220 [Burkholderiales bacterium]|nr:hypothetical protein [Burkholderiales bacterium]
MKSAAFKSGFAILDVRSGRQALAKRIAAGEKVRVRIDLVLDAAEHEDGISIEFSGAVLSVKQFKSPARAGGKRKARRS